MAAVIEAEIGLGSLDALDGLPQNVLSLACLDHLALFQMVSAIPRSLKLLKVCGIYFPTFHSL